MGTILLGTSGYSFNDWIGNVYPSNLKKSEMFQYYLQHFRLNSVEINYTYYKMPSRNVFKHYAAATAENFKFCVKLFSGITHAPWMKNGTGELDGTLAESFLFGIAPIIEANKLGSLLAQFPPHLKPTDKTWNYLLLLRKTLLGCPLVVEFRNNLWINKFTFKTLRSADIGFCAVDEPNIEPLMPLISEVTADVAYLRLHGRSPLWFSDSRHRYDYLYTSAELESFLPVIKDMQSRSQSLYIMFNNCHAGSAVRNVQMMQYLLDLDVPPLQGVLFD